MSTYTDASLIVTPNAKKAGKLYALKGADLDVVRATTATRVNSSGLIETVSANVPRLDYSNGSCPSILVEPQRTNLVLRSGEFDNSSWLKLSSTITENTTTAPDGTTTADKLVEDNTNANHLVQQAVVASNTSYTFSVFAKKAERNWVVLRSVNASFQNVKAWFNIDNGTIGNLENGATAKISSYSNGWYKLEMTIPSFSTGFEFRISTSTGNGIDSYLGTTGSGIFIWGAQLEAGSYATSYIPTTSASVTRNADVISKTGISSLIGQTEGTVILDVNLNSRAQFTYFVLAGALASSQNYLGIFFGSSAIGFESVVSGALQAGINFSNNSTGRFKIGIGYKANDFILYINGNLIGTDTSGSVPACNDLSLSAYSNVATINYNTVTLWKTRLSNTQLAELTNI